jgi:cytochrome o ubiquinol oxidase subunit 2
MPLLDPSGPIGAAEKSVLLTAIGLMLIVVVPVFLMTFWFAWRYRASNRKARYAPEWASSGKIELAVWLVPAVIVSLLGLLTWNATHRLSPYRPLASAKDPLPIDAVAMNWKWLFIYPRQHIATVNQLALPTNVPVSFRLTSQTVMASFFIPRLGSQIYAMPGMRTKLHLLADKAGIYTGRNFQFSGRGYSWMQFQVIATSPQKFDVWIDKIKRSSRKLNLAAFQKLERPSIETPTIYYAAVHPHLFEYIIHQVMTGQGTYASNGAVDVG